jgi:hypothetical protein
VRPCLNKQEEKEEEKRRKKGEGGKKEEVGDTVAGMSKEILRNKRKMDTRQARIESFFFPCFFHISLIWGELFQNELSSYYTIMVCYGSGILLDTEVTSSESNRDYSMKTTVYVYRHTLIQYNRLH